MEYIKQITGNINKDYELLKKEHIIYLDWVGDINNIKTQQELMYIKGIWEGHIKGMNGYYKDDILNNLGAVIELPETIDEYFKIIGCKSRNMIRKAKQNGFTIKKNWEFDDYIDDYHEIYTSKKIRQGKIMSSAKLEKPKKRGKLVISDNKYVNLLNYGCFIDNKLVAFMFPYVVNDTLNYSTGVGHGDYLKFGIMNLLIYSICEDIITNFKNIKYFLYIWWFSGEKGLRDFKKSMGFYPKLVSLKNIYKNNFLNEDLNVWNKTNSVNLESNKLTVKDSNETTPGIFLSIPILANQKYICTLIFEASPTTIIILFGRDLINKKDIFKKEILSDNYVIFSTPNNISSLEINIAFRNPISDNYILIKSIELKILDKVIGYNGECLCSS